MQSIPLHQQNTYFLFSGDGFFFKEPFITAWSPVLGNGVEEDEDDEEEEDEEEEEAEEEDDEEEEELLLELLELRERHLLLPISRGCSSR